MGVFGIKILENDLALDTYGHFFDLYDADTTLEEIKKVFELERRELLEDPDDYEHFICAYALASWEVDSLNLEIKKEVKKIVDKSNLKETLQNEGDEALAKKRQKVLDRFLEKISAKNFKPKKRNPKKKIKNFIFQADDVLSFKLNNGNYACCIVVLVSQFKVNHVNYFFAPVFYQGKSPAKLKDVKFVIGSSVNSGLSEEEIRKTQPETVEIYWKKEPPEKRSYPHNYELDLRTTAINHKYLISFKDRFKWIGKIKIKPGYKNIGTISGATNFNSFQKDYVERFLKKREEEFYYRYLPLKIIAENFEN